MRYIRLKARAKINLTLDALKKREDGYHELEMVMQEISLCDDIFVKKTERHNIEIITNLRWLPTDERNLAYKAAELIIKKYNIRNGVLIDINKRIPVSAGLAGGSSDGAAVIKALNSIFELNISQHKLMEYGAEIGSDVPFCMLGGTALAKGRGEILKRLNPCPKFYVILVKIPVSVSTTSVFKNLDLNTIEKRPDTKLMLSAIESKKINLIAKNLSNVLETVTIPMFPKIDIIKHELLQLGAIGTLMSGSGPSVYGIFETKKMACIGADSIRKNLKLNDVFVCETINN